MERWQPLQKRASQRGSHLLQPLVIAFQLLTRIPIPVSVDHTPELRERSLLFYPLVGGVIGGGLWLLQALLVSYPVVLQATLLLIFWVGITGGLHLDGLADSADAWVGGMGDRQRMLEIMKDPASGPMGVTAIVLILLIKWSLLYTLIDQQQVALLIWSPLLARLLLIPLFQTTAYLRSEGMGSALTGEGAYWPGVAVLLLGLLLAWWGGVDGVVLLLLLLGAALFRYRVVKQLGGITGDLAGAMVEKMEVWLLLLVVLLQ